jgi:hypothetical protein
VELDCPTESGPSSDAIKYKEDEISNNNHDFFNIPGILLPVSAEKIESGTSSASP